MAEQLTSTQRKVLNVLPHGRENARHSKELAKLLGMTQRNFSITSRQLAMKGVPIVGLRHGEYDGTFIATTEEEKQEGLRAIESQAYDMLKRIETVKRIDTEHWQELFEDDTED